jgi:hypothetical protein
MREEKVAFDGESVKYDEKITMDVPSDFLTPYRFIGCKKSLISCNAYPVDKTRFNN